jgi:hypothetical protein
MVSTTLKNFNMNRMKDLKNTFKPVTCVLYFAWDNQNLALPIPDLEARASTVTFCLYFPACSPCASLADSFITPTSHCPPSISTAGVAYIITTCLSLCANCRWISRLACILTICLSLCATCLHALELYSILHHKHLSDTLHRLCPSAVALQYPAP